jgi:hypothetical protein
MTLLNEQVMTPMLEQGTSPMPFSPVDQTPLSLLRGGKKETDCFSTWERTESIRNS